jgi:hypothetical protein
MWVFLNPAGEEVTADLGTTGQRSDVGLDTSVVS